MKEKLIKADSLLEQIESPYVEYPVMIGIRNAIKEMIYEASEVNAIPIKQLLSILPKYDDYIHTKTYLHNETLEAIYSKGHEEGWKACLKAIKEELEDWEKENETSRCR